MWYSDKNFMKTLLTNHQLPLKEKVQCHQYFGHFLSWLSPYKSPHTKNTQMQVTLHFDISVMFFISKAFNSSQKNKCLTETFIIGSTTALNLNCEKYALDSHRVSNFRRI